MPKLSAGILVFRFTPKAQVEVFLVHPGGPFWAKKNNGSWSLPKGEYSDDEDSFAAAKREFHEETGNIAPEGDYLPIGEVKYGNKKVVAWAVQGDLDAEKIKSNFFEMEWPPKSGETGQFAEVDKAGWFTIDAARKKLVKGQVLFVDQLLEVVKQADKQQALF